MMLTLCFLCGRNCIFKFFIFFSLFSSVLPDKFRDSSPFTPRPVPSKSFPIHRPSVFLPFDGMYSRYWRHQKHVVCPPPRQNVDKRQENLLDTWPTVCDVAHDTLSNWVLNADGNLLHYTFCGLERRYGRPPSAFRTQYTVEGPGIWDVRVVILRADHRRSGVWSLAGNVCRAVTVINWSTG
jgi:hypothetical protein